MAINIVDMLKSQIGSQIAGQVAKQFGASEQAAKTGIEAMIPTVLGGLLKQVSAPGGAEKLDSTLSQGGFDGGLLENITGMFTGGSGGTGTSGTAESKGPDLVSMLFGDKVSMIAPILAKLTGMKPETILSILSVVAPLIMSFLGKQKQVMGLDANGLAGLITSQRDNIAASMPLGMADAMGLGSLGIASPAAASSTAATSASAPSSGGSMAKVLVPLVVAAAVGFGCYKYIFAGIRPTGAEGNTVIQIDEEAFRRMEAAENSADAASMDATAPATMESQDEPIGSVAE